ncbi:MAG: OmpA family protein [Bacteroidetes bacterium]|nr:OmpA family protein [Bacteroidota bacterium]
MKKLLIVLFLVFGAIYNSLAQDKPRPWAFELERADMAYKAKKFNTAANLYQKVYPKVKDQDEKQLVLFKIADSYRKSNNFKQAIKWFEEVVNSKYPDPKVLFSYGQLLKNFERYDEAGRAFYDFLFEVPDDALAKDAMAGCSIASEWKANPQKFTITNLENLNSEFSDYSPFWVNDKLIFTSSRKESQGSGIFEWTGQKYSDLFEVNLTGNDKPSPIKSLNTDFNEGVAWLDAEGRSAYFTQCNGIDGKGLNCKIYVSYFNDNKWTAPQALPFNSDSFSCGHPAFSPDGKTLFISSDRPGGLGEKDIWMVPFDPVKNNWGEPQNPGNAINSADDELFPWVDENNILYFASKGHIGMGGLDIFKAEKSGNGFKTAENLKYPINSGADDFGLIMLPESKRKQQAPFAWFSSNREGGKGDDDLYSISIKPFVFLVKGQVKERESNQAMSGVQVEAMDENGKTILQTKTNDKGEFAGEIPLNTIASLSIKKNGFLSPAAVQLNSMGVQKDTTAILNFLLDAIPTQDIEITMQGIYYDVDKWDIRSDARPVLDSLSNVLKANPSLVIELASHTDSRAPAEYNLELSKKRAISCVNYLSQKGIPKDRMVPVGYGETKLVNDCSDDVDCSEEEHQMNRRTTVRVLRNDYKNKGR